MKTFLKVGISGVRGVVGESFTPQLAATFAQAFGSYVGQGPVVVGRDTRPSGYVIEHAVVAGLQSAGCKPILAGVVPIPTLLMLILEHGARGGVGITASHNPAQWNALKFVGPNGMFLNQNRAEELFDIYHQGDFRQVPETDIPSATPLRNATDGHFARVLSYVDSEAIRKCRFKVAVDCCNGVGAVHTRGFLERLGCEVVTCLDAPSGAFEREPEPLPENLGALRSLVQREHCAIGFAQDPDGDRLAIVDETGSPIGEDMTIAFAAQQVLEKHRKGPVAVNLATSRSIQRIAEQHGCPFQFTKIGEINVSETMVAIGAAVGGEGNGGVIIPDIHPCRDSYAGMAIVLELLAHSGKTVSSLCAEIPRYVMVKEKIQIRGEMAGDILRGLRRRYEDKSITLIDGVHVEMDSDTRFLVRLSNTEPVIRIVTEAPDIERAQALAADVRRDVETLAAGGT